MASDTLTPAELAALQKLDELYSFGFGNINGVPIVVVAGALRELAALREQVAAERAKRAALVREFRRRCEQRKEPLSPPLGYPSSAAAAWHDAAVLLAALDQPGGA